MDGGRLGAGLLYQKSNIFKTMLRSALHLTPIILTNVFQLARRFLCLPAFLWLLITWEGIKRTGDIFYTESAYVGVD
jgi:hypothetical protein